MKTAADVLTILAQLITFAAIMLLVFSAVSQVLYVLMPWALALMCIAVDLQGAAECLLGKVLPTMTCGAGCAILGWLLWVFWPRPTAGGSNRITLTWGRR